MKIILGLLTTLCLYFVIDKLLTLIVLSIKLVEQNIQHRKIRNFLFLVRMKMRKMRDELN